MPLSNANQRNLPEQQRPENDLTHSKKRRLSDNCSNQNNKRFRENTDLSQMTDSQKRANFSALTSPSNGINRHASPLANSKPGSTKKLIIKNFKGMKGQI